jgi:hypothetical protein
VFQCLERIKVLNRVIISDDTFTCQYALLIIMTLRTNQLKCQNCVLNEGK